VPSALAFLKLLIKLKIKQTVVQT